MLGILLNQKELYEMKSLVKREMDRIQREIKRGHPNAVVTRNLEEKYHILFALYMRVASLEEGMKDVGELSKFNSRE